MASPALRHLARLYGIQTAYYDVAQQLCLAKPESLLHALRALAVPIEREDQAEEFVVRRRRQLWDQLLPPVSVAWNGKANITVRLPAELAEEDFTCEILLEDGPLQKWTGTTAQLATERHVTIGETAFVRKRFISPLPLPTGYHRFVLEVGSRKEEAWIISAPQLAYQLATSRNKKAWGAFVPLYALHSQSSWGGGDFSDLERLTNWISDLGGDLVATLPLLAWMPEVSEDPSPYSPASRLFWNEFYLDVARIPEYQSCQAAQDLVASSEFQRELNELRASETVDYQRQSRLKRQVLSLLATSLSPAREREFEEYRNEHPDAESYAQFRAVGETQGGTWTSWPEPLRNGQITEKDYDKSLAHYYLYCQWQVEQQLQQLAQQTRRRDMLWYLDFSLGVNSDGYDTWKYRDLFVLDTHGGAPPDSFFTKGQDWGFPPLHPENIRQQGYQYLIQSLRRHLKYARLLRIDHVMGLHRLYWIPQNLPADQGVYVRYQTQEMFAILSVESHRHQAQIIGENLGTVPRAVNDAMEIHGIHDMYVVQYESTPGQPQPLRNVPRNTIASLNTHDMPMFAAFWNALDVEDRVDLGLMDQQEAGEEEQRRSVLRSEIVRFLQGQQLLEKHQTEDSDVLQAILLWLAASPAEVVLVTLEDLWGERLPQNTPGTYRERCNWRRKAQYDFETFSATPEFHERLARIDQARTQPRSSAMD